MKCRYKEQNLKAVAEMVSLGIVFPLSIILIIKQFSYNHIMIAHIIVHQNPHVNIGSSYRVSRQFGSANCFPGISILGQLHFIDGYNGAS